MYCLHETMHVKHGVGMEQEGGGRRGEEGQSRGLCGWLKKGFSLYVPVYVIGVSFSVLCITQITLNVRSTPAS